MTKIGALIVTFSPELLRLKENIDAIIKQIDQIVLVDNGSSNVDAIEKMAEPYGINVIRLHNEHGIAGAQNEGMKFLMDAGMDWGLTLDQDSVLPKNGIEKYTKTPVFNDATTGILAAQYDDPNWTDDQRAAKLDSTGKAIVEKKMVIASGNLVKISAWKEVGGYDEWMFIDQVDFDFNAKLLIAGYKIWQVNEVVMNHEVGKVVQNKILAKILLFPKTAIFSDHSAFREYYIQRNTIVYSKRYPEFRRHRLQTLVSMIQSRRILVYSNPLPKLFAAWKGIIDGIKYAPSLDVKFMAFRESVDNKNES